MLIVWILLGFSSEIAKSLGVSVELLRIVEILLPVAMVVYVYIIWKFGQLDKVIEEAKSAEKAPV